MDLHQSFQPPMDRMVVVGIRAVPVLCKLNAKFVSVISVTMKQNETQQVLFMVFSRQDSGLVQCALVCVSYKQDERLPIFFPAEMLIDMMACCHLVTFTAIFPVEKFPPHFLKCLSFFRLTMYAHVQCMQYDRMFKTYIFLSTRTLNLKLQD